MTTSAPTPPSGPNSTTPDTGGAPPMRGRKRPASSAFIQRKPPPKKAATGAKPGPSGGPVPTNGVRAPITHRPGSASGQQTTNGLPAAPPSTTQQRSPDSTFVLRISKSDIEQGMRYHGFKFAVKADKTRQEQQLVDPYNTKDFTRPLRLHRRYAHDKPETGDQSDAPPGADDKERELFNAKRAERQAERDFNQAQIAPTGSASKKAQPKKKNEKLVQDVWYDENNARQKKASQLRYEETKPWHLEDDDNKNVWIGSYQEPLSETSVLFTIDSDSGFTMTPIERWYKFQQTNRLPSMSSEAAEKIMQQKGGPSRWFLNTHVGQQEAKASAIKQQREKALAVKRASEDDSAYRKVKDEGEFYNEDVDVLDLEFQDEEFQDDDEGTLVVGENQEETDEIERRIRQEMRGAGVSAPGLKDSGEGIDQEEAQAKADKREQRKREKKMKKQLVKKEKQFHYESDSDSSDPYGESDDSTDSEEEREREEAERKEEEAKKLAQANGGDRSGASTKGTNTPSGRPEKKDFARANISSLKRPGSPNLSDVSGNESRKKAKVSNGAKSPNSGSLSPNRAHTGYGSGSETESSRRRRAPLTSRPGSATNSRPHSPAPAASMPTREQVRDAIPAGGITIGDLVQRFRSRVAGKENMNVFIALVREAGQQDPVTKLIVPKAAREDAGA